MLLRIVATGVAFSVFSGFSIVAGVAHAHITLIEPRPRTDSQKDGPCGAVGSVRGDRVAVFQPGETIAVMWDETVDHDSHYRVAFDVDGDDDFVAPAGDHDLYNSPAVLVDDIADERGGGRYVQMVTLPSVECERCTLQLIQVMYGAGNYFQCADLALRADGSAPPPPAQDAGTPARNDAGAGIIYGDAGTTSPPPRGTPPPSGTPPPESPRDAPPGLVTGGCRSAPGPTPSLPLLLVAPLLLGLIARRKSRL